MANLNLNFAMTRDVPVVQQTEQAECGLVCLLMIANYYGQSFELHELRERFPTSHRGTTLAKIMDIASELRLGATPLQVTLPPWASSRLPAFCIGVPTTLSC